MKNTLFLSLSLLTMAFSVQAQTVAEILAANKVKTALKTALTTTSDQGAFVYSQRKFFSAAQLVAKNAKVPVVALPAAVVAGGIYTLDRVQAKNLQFTQPTKMQRVKNALNDAGSLVKSNVQAHPRIVAGAGLVTLAGLSYATYNKFGKAVKKSTVASTPVASKAEVKKATPVVVTSVKAKKAAKRLPGGYARRK